MEILDENISIIVENEILLTEDEIRNDANEISNLLSTDFIEYTSSGKIYHYTVGDVFGSNDGKIVIDRESIKCTKLSEDVFLLLYIAVKSSNNDNSIRSNRSSIWKNVEGKWKIVFHQGTNI